MTIVGFLISRTLQADFGVPKSGRYSCVRCGRREFVLAEHNVLWSSQFRCNVWCSARQRLLDFTVCLGSDRQSAPIVCSVVLSVVSTLTSKPTVRSEQFLHCVTVI